MTKILSGRTDGPSQRTHGQPDQFWASIQPMGALFPLSKLQSIYGRRQGEGEILDISYAKNHTRPLYQVQLEDQQVAWHILGLYLVFSYFPPSIGLHSNYGGRGKLQTFCMLKIIPGRYIRSNQMTHIKYDQFWASIYPLGHSIGLFPAPDSIYEGGIFFKKFATSKIIRQLSTAF